MSLHMNKMHINWFRLSCLINDMHGWIGDSLSPIVNDPYNLLDVGEMIE